MARSIPQAGYESVSHSDEGLGEKGGLNSLNMDKSYEAGPMLPQQSTDLSLSPTTNEDDRTFWQKCNSFWVWELTTCTISMGCLGVVIWTLCYLDGDPLSKWPLSMTPASFLSTFVTISRFMLLVGVAEGIGQLRWLYYLGGSRRLDHLESFDSASRGPWGSFLFLCRKSIQGISPSIARFGAVLMIVALAMDPMTQQILEYYDGLQEYRENGDAWIYATNYAGPTPNDGLLTDDSRRRSIYGGLLNFDETPPFGCTSGNCTWDPFSSLGYDFSCRDVANTATKVCAPGSGVLGVNCTAIQYSLTNANFSMTLQNGSDTFTQAAGDGTAFTILKSIVTDPFPRGLNDSLLFRFMIAQLLIGRNDDGFDTTNLSNPSWNMTVCDVKYCAKVYQGLRVVNGRFINTSPQIQDIGPLTNSSCWTERPQTCAEYVALNQSAIPQGSSPIYRVAIDNTPVNVRNFLSFDYNITVSANNLQSDDNTNGAYNLATGLFWNVNITQIFQHAASTLTDYMRQSPGSQHINGTLQYYTTYVNVRWGYFALPAAVDLLGPVFLIVVIIYTARGIKGEKLIWKTNTLPLLMHGLQGYSPHGYAGAETTGAIFRKATQMNVQLRRNEDGEIRFVRT